MNIYQYEVEGRRVVLEEEENLVAVRFKEPAKHSMRSAVSRGAGVHRFDERLEVPNEKFTVIDLRPRAPAPGTIGPAAVTPQSPQDKKTTLATSDQVEQVMPVFRHGGTRMFATDRVIVGLHATASAEVVASSVGGELVDSDGNEHVIRLAPAGDPLAAAKALSQRAVVEYAEPDFVSLVQKLARRAAPQGAGVLDPLATRQYAIGITRAEQAWAKVRGSAAIKIAILDEGVDTSHEDLAGAIVGSYDAADNDSYQEPNPWDGHGTACAGLAAAVHNDFGVRGIGGGCSLLAVRIAYSDAPGGDWTITNSGVGRAIDWSWRNGAAVLSNSWGGGAPSTRVTRAFRRAMTQGREGKGCVVVAAAGNSDSDVSFPANLPGVVCVSASNEYDQPKTRTSHDGETWWGSCFGPEVAVAAPGVHNYTTDITGTGGYNRGPTHPNYVTDFNGTSSATPIVAGAVGLMLSANPALHADDVRRILVQTADKVGAVEYDAGGHHPRMGHGRVNVAAAVDAALALSVGP